MSAAVAASRNGKYLKGTRSRTGGEALAPPIGTGSTTAGESVAGELPPPCVLGDQRTEDNLYISNVMEADLPTFTPFMSAPRPPPSLSPHQPQPGRPIAAMS